jgi:drug/metabolite transporter (DMT)-like permease
MRPHPSLLPFLFVFLWSTGFIGAKFGLPYAEPLTFLLVRYLLILALMTTVALADARPMAGRCRARWLHIGVSGLLVHALISVACSWPSGMGCRLA